MIMPLTYRAFNVAVLQRKQYFSQICALGAAQITLPYKIPGILDINQKSLFKIAINYARVTTLERKVAKASRYML